MAIGSNNVLRAMVVNRWRTREMSAEWGWAALTCQDSTYEFEKRRNVPVRYDRELVATTLKAMERVSEIRQKREKAFWKNRYVVVPVAVMSAVCIRWRCDAHHLSSRRARSKASSVRLVC